MLTRKKLVQAQCESCWTDKAELAVIALKKQIPEKPKIKKYETDTDAYLYEAYCPNCKTFITAMNEDEDYETPSYCDYCGQALKWDN